MLTSDIFQFKTNTYDSEYLLQIRDRADQPLVTVAPISGPACIRQFGIWIGEGVDENGEDIQADIIVPVQNLDDLMPSWRNAVALAYREAVMRAA